MWFTIDMMPYKSDVVASGAADAVVSQANAFFAAVCSYRHQKLKWKKERNGKKQIGLWAPHSTTNKFRFFFSLSFHFPLFSILFHFAFFLLFLFPKANIPIRFWESNKSNDNIRNKYTSVIHFAHWSDARILISLVW